MPIIQSLVQEGIGITEILHAIVTRIPPPKDTAGSPLRALIFDRLQILHWGLSTTFILLISIEVLPCKEVINIGYLCYGLFYYKLVIIDTLRMYTNVSCEFFLKLPPVHASLAF